MDNFSKRHGFRGTPPPITVREEAPEEVRAFVLSVLKEYVSAPDARDLVCRVLRKLPDRNNWSDGNVWNEVQYQLEDCEWFHIYNLIEAICSDVFDNLKPFAKPNPTYGITFYGPDHFAEDVNILFEDLGIGWKLESGQIVIRGNEFFEALIHNSPEALRAAGMITASEEIHKAIEDLSKRPNPDRTGAVQHGMTALECAAKHVAEVTGKQTLDDVVKARPDLFRPPLNEAVIKLWGFASQRGRHLQEGGEPTHEEVELVVSIAASLATYLSRITKLNP